MTKPMLREREPGRHAPVTTVELFFDLVFVFAVTQLSHDLLAERTAHGAAGAGLVLMAVWWAWINTAWVTNWLNPDNPVVRVMLFVLMGMGLVMSTSLPEALGDRGLVFALAYAAFQLGRTVFMIIATRGDVSLRRNFQRTALWFAGSGCLWLIGALADGEARMALWAAALLAEYAAPTVGYWLPRLGRTDTQEWTVEGGHMAERCGLFVIVCLGESVLITGMTFAKADWNPAIVAAFVSSLLASIAMWWIYFDGHATTAGEAIAESRDPGRIARLAYTYAHIPMVAGIIVTAAGDELALARPLGAMTPQVVWLVLGGPALFLVGTLWFKYAVFGAKPPSRLVGLALVAAAWAAAPRLTPLALSAIATAVLMFVAIWEALTPPNPLEAGHPVAKIDADA